MRTFKGILSLILYVVNLIGLAIIVLFAAFIALLMPTRGSKKYIQEHVLRRMPIIFARVNRWIMAISTQDRWDVAGTGNLKKNQWYAILSNHCSWIDILVLSKIFDNRLPPLKFFMKKALLWQLPFAGLACYVLNYPFMSRHSRAEIKKNPQLKNKDMESTKKACLRFRQYPGALINFIESTRFTAEKRERQQSPFQHLLKPRAGGISMTIQELHDLLSGIVNVTIYYPKKIPSVWEFACGRFDRVVVRYECLPITPDLIGDYNNDREFRAYLQQWLNNLWSQKDALLTRFVEEYEHQSN